MRKSKENALFFRILCLNMHIDKGLQSSYNRSYITVEMYCIETMYYIQRTISKERRICVELVQSRVKYPFSHQRRCV